MATPIPSGMFTYVPQTRTLVAEASTIGFAAMDMIDVESDITGNVVSFVFDRCDRDEEGEVGGWRYKAIAPEVDVKLLIIND